MPILEIPDNNMPRLIVQQIEFSIKSAGAPDLNEATLSQLEKAINILGIAYYFTLEAFHQDLKTEGLPPHQVDRSKRQLDNAIKKDALRLTKDIDWNS